MLHKTGTDVHCLRFRVVRPCRLLHGQGNLET
jgi:hypothetical protein